jgi:serine/threonine protein phosphatase 1
MRTLAIGDIHGCLRALTTLLDAVAPAADDRLIVLGDYVDRGPDSCAVLDLLIDLRVRGRLTAALLGNHEQMMREARESRDACRMWLACGGRAAIASYPGVHLDPSDLSMIPEAHWEFIERCCVDYYETSTHFFVHGNAFYDIPLDEQPWEMLRWEMFQLPLPHVSGKVMVCGHTKQCNGLPHNVGHGVCIDTGVYDEKGWLTCLEVETGRIWQANQAGERRTGQLGEPVAADTDW